MQLQLTILFACVFLALAWNAVLLWYIRRALQRANVYLDENRVWYTHLGETLRSSVHTAEGVTSRLVLASAETRAAVEELSETMDRADNWARYGLAKLDFNVGRTSTKLRTKTRRLGSQLGDVLFSTAAAIQGLRAALAFIARWKVGGVRSATRAAAPGPIGTTLIVLDALRALGKLFESRRRGSGQVDAQAE